MIGGETSRNPMAENLPATRAEKPPHVATGHKFFLLFLFLLIYLALYPYTQDGGPGYVVFRLIALAITFLSVYAVSFRRGLILVAVVLAIPALLHRLDILKNGTSAVSILTTLLTMAFDAFIITVIFRRVFVRGRHDSEAIFGALSIYLLVGFGFSSVYDLLYRLQRHAFYLDPGTNLHTLPNRFDFIYYSFATMTSLGAAGITAVSDQARSLSVIESLLGLLYLAVLISKLMGAYSSEERTNRER